MDGELFCRMAIVAELDWVGLIRIDTISQPFIHVYEWVSFRISSRSEVQERYRRGTGFGLGLLRVRVLV